MSTPSPRILVTGASGHLGRLIVEALLKSVPADRIVATARSITAIADLAALGVETRAADYDKPETLVAAFAGIDRLVLVSSNAIGQREPQHRNVIEAAKAAGVGFVAYTSILHADTSSLGLRVEHLATEALLKASGIPFALLRNGWYTENYNGNIGPALEHGVVFGASGDGRIAAATRADYAAAAAVVLAGGDEHAGKVYELAGDTAFTLADWAAELSKLAGKPVAFNNLPEAEYQALLVKFGLPEGFAALLADSDAGAAKGGLYDDSHTLSRLIGRPTTPLATVLAAALKS